MKRTQRVPSGLKELIEFYGNPDVNHDAQVDKGWYFENIKQLPLPFPLRLAWDIERKITHLPVHRLVMDSLYDALKDIETEVGLDFLHQHDMDRTAGAYCFRPIKGGNALSTHSWGIAIDLNSHVARWGAAPETQLKVIVQAFKAQGWIWGGDWKAPYTCDPMHFQLVSNY